MRKVLGFGWRFLLAYGLFVAVWVGILEKPYNDYLAWSCERILARVEQPRLTTDMRREGHVLMVEHVPHFANTPPHEIVMRRIHSNTALFAALTLATPQVGWALRTMWLAGGAVLLGASHTAHTAAYVHHPYALRNMAQYYTSVRSADLDDLPMGEIWRRPAALRRYLALTTADVFNTVLQRVVPIALWLPLLLISLRRGVSESKPLALPTRTSAGRLRRVTAACAGVAVLALAAVYYTDSAEKSESIDGLRPGMGAVAAKRIVEELGYEWVTRPPMQDEERSSRRGFVDVWPRRGPVINRMYGPRFNWIGLTLAQPPDRKPTVYTTCITRIETAPSDSRPERLDFGSEHDRDVCREHWKRGE